MKTKRIIALLLCVVMLSGLACISALADEEAPAYDGRYGWYKHYSFFGDSVPAGVGMEAEGQWNFGWDRIEGAYPDLVADALGYEHSFYYTNETTGAIDYSFAPMWDYWNKWTLTTNVSSCATMGFRTCDVRMLLERGMDPENYYEPDDYYYINNQKATMDGLLNYMGYMGNYYEFVNQWTADSDLITVGVGSNDIFTVPLMTMIEQSSIDLSALMGEDNTIDLSAILKFISGSKDMVNELIGYIKAGVENIYNNYPAIIEDFKTISPDADILITSLYNPFAGHKLTAGSSGTLLADSMSIFIGSINDFLQKLANETDNVYFVDVSRVETQFGKDIALLSPEMFGNILNDIHPSAAGHRYMADQILSVLEKINACPHEHTVAVIRSSGLLKLLGIADEYYCTDCGKLLKSADLASLSTSFPLQNTLSAIVETQVRMITNIFKNLFSIFTIG